jgi:hypothetical protein
VTIVIRFHCWRGSFFIVPNFAKVQSVTNHVGHLRATICDEVELFGAGTDVLEEFLGLEKQREWSIKCQPVNLYEHDAVVNVIVCGAMLSVTDLEEANASDVGI